MKLFLMFSVLTSMLLAVGQGRNMPSFTDYDTNSDGKISEKELIDGRDKRHNEMVKEGKMLRNAKNAPSFSELDTNGNGYISKEEFKKHQDAMRGL